MWCTQLIPIRTSRHRFPGAQQQPITPNASLPELSELPYPIQHFLVPAIIVCLSVILLLRIGSALNLGDFSAFYCGGKALRMEIDPYRIASLSRCENTVLGVFHHRLLNGETIPAPFPPYALAIFAIFAILPPAAASTLWIIVLVASYAVIVLTLRSMTHQRITTIIAATVIPMVMVPLPVGQLTLPVFALLITAAQALRHERIVPAAIAMLGTMLSPIIGIPACIGLAAIDRRTVIPLVIGVLTWASINTVAIPLPATMYYFSTALPGHAFAELRHDHQYSLSHLLRMLGFTPNASLALGLLDYVIMIIFGVLIAIALAKRAHRRDIALFAAPTAAMLGGSFVHLSALSVASMTALFVHREISTCENPPRHTKLLVPAAILALALPVEALHSPIDIAIFAGVAFILGYGLFRMRLRALAIMSGCAALGAIAALVLLSLRGYRQMPDSQLSEILQKAVANGQSLEKVWRLYINGHIAWQGWTSVVLQLPVICGIIFVLFSMYMISEGIALRIRLPRI